jgi:transcriptional regulator with XRE-family HTH domain
MARKLPHAEKWDQTVGFIIYKTRLMKGMSRQELADKIGVTHQQLQKYEKGVNRISAGRLFLVSQALAKPIEYFFKDMDSDYEGRDSNIIETSSQRKCMEVSRNFMRIKNEEHQNAINFLVRKLANADQLPNAEVEESSAASA